MKYRIVRDDDRNTTVRIFRALESAQRFTGDHATRYEIQRAILATDGSVFEWERTALSESPRRWAGNL